jgi:hypothetical protein
VTLIGFKESRSDHGEGSFAGPGFPHQTEDLAGSKVEISGMEGDRRTISLSDLMEFENSGNATPQTSNLMVSDSFKRYEVLPTGFDGLGAARTEETACLRDKILLAIQSQ